MTHRRVVAALMLTASTSLVLGLIAAGGAWRAPLAGLPDAGRLTTWALTAAQLAVVLLGARVIGLLTAVTLMLPTTADTIGRDSVPLMRRAALCSAWWAVAALAASVLTLAVALGISGSQAMTPGVLRTYVWALPASRDFLYAAALALVIAAAGPMVASLNSVIGLAGLAAIAIAAPLLSSHSAGLGDHSLAVTSSVVHGLAVSVWLGGLWAILPAVADGNSAVIRRFSTVAGTCFAALALAGTGAAYARLDSVSDLWATGYGRVVVVKVVLLTCLGIIATRLRLNLTPHRGRLVSVELMLMGIAAGLGAALHDSPFSRTPSRFATAGEELLGFPYPQPPTVTTLLTGWHPEWAMVTTVVVLGALYIMGSLRVGVRPLRSASFAIGLVLMLWSTSSNIAQYAMVSFQAHMIAHMVLSMLAPLFLVLGAPITLALQALPAVSPGHARSPRRWATSLLHSRYSRFITNPVVDVATFVFGLYGVYFTPLFSALMGSHSGHVFMEFHFLITGLLFAFTVVGVDPAPRRLPHWARLIMVLVAMSAHAFFAVSLMQAQTPIGDAWYSQVRPPWLTDPVADTIAGGGVAWAFGEIPTLLLLVALSVQWARSDSRLAARLDREADRTGDAELAAYNERLAELHRRESAT